ncbi:hypothetical protein LTR99_007270 [Exophiala xenobiotica]|uniref:Uncharacterized protein n=1 Tax=Vermiconidia calcicola TaxID=1690605 RepID=A0AAV9Q261_9PEZI|nr:hypothetical protein LTR41_006886 [Exophiala xenobiotica]KAK5534380.1 hypothetical protein LTR25_006412 [Vermiconidia calcicola]KAK5227970.1 hypothetical protein LTR72_001853 [Exophiala xenobiotica]KAK5299002.1 hypothetical protein LTR99_007270 [Exophiala xenobiotica]KAK5417422.1 hypothetical protein LTR90_004596 [Exophiala xenobiotica]
MAINDFVHVLNAIESTMPVVKKHARSIVSAHLVSISEVKRNRNLVGQGRLPSDNSFPGSMA